MHAREQFKTIITPYFA